MGRFPTFAIAALLAIAAATARASPAPAAQRTAAPSIASSFETFWTAARGKPFDRQLALWNRYIEDPRETLYRSVVWDATDIPNWRRWKTDGLKMRFGQYPRIASRIPREAATIVHALRAASGRFRKLLPGASRKPRVALVLSPDFDSKSGVLPDGTPILALAVDTLLLEKANLRILLPHELFHLYDAQHAGVMNDGVMPGTHLTLPLFAEGLAVCVSSQVSPGYADGQYMFGKMLGRLPASRLPAAARAFLADASSETIDPKTHGISRLHADWFEGDSKALNPPYPNRAGYGLGLNLIRRLRATHSLQQMASWTPGEAQRHMLTALAAMAARS